MKTNSLLTACKRAGAVSEEAGIAAWRKADEVAGQLAKEAHALRTESLKTVAAV